MSISPSLKNRIRRLEQALSDTQAETLEDVVRASFLASTLGAESEELDTACLASLDAPTIPRGRPGWLYQLILRARGQHLRARLTVAGAQP